MTWCIWHKRVGEKKNHLQEGFYSNNLHPSILYAFGFSLFVSEAEEPLSLFHGPVNKVDFSDHPPLVWDHPEPTPLDKPLNELAVTPSDSEPTLPP